jgi:hypothetical protein
MWLVVEMADIKKGETLVMAGTKKGLFLLHSKDRKKWKTEGPFIEGMPVRHALLSPNDHKTVFASGWSGHWGPAIAASPNTGGRWKRTKGTPHYSKESGLSVEAIWSFAQDDDGTLFAGVEPAGLFRSKDNGNTWASVDGLNQWGGRKDWQPGNGGLILHTVLPYPGNTDKMVVGISSVGVFGTKDGGDHWKCISGGVHGVFEPDKVMKDGEIGHCPHKLARDATDPRQLYMQDHAGVYRRREGDDAWTAAETGLPKWKKEKNRRWTFGFAMAAHPSKKGWAYLLPLVGDWNRVTKDGVVRVYRTKDGAKSWSEASSGLPKKGAYMTVLRDAMRTDTNDPAGVYFGTTTGQVYASRNDGNSWQLAADNLPPVLSVDAGVVGG